MTRRKNNRVASEQPDSLSSAPVELIVGEEDVEMRLYAFLAAQFKSYTARG